MLFCAVLGDFSYAYVLNNGVVSSLSFHGIHLALFPVVFHKVQLGVATCILVCWFGSLSPDGIIQYVCIGHEGYPLGN